MGPFISSSSMRLAAAAVLGLQLLVTSSVIPEVRPRAVECLSDGPGAPVQVTANCIDPLYDAPVIDGEVDVLTPVPHHRVSGHFEDTRIKFNIYLPPKDIWEGRFYQLVYPLQNEIAEDREIAFGVDSGAYSVKATGGLGYRSDAAVAKFSREVARTYYAESEHPIFGYIYGGSGGSFQTIGGMENTVGVWDGALALVLATPASNPNTFVTRALGGLVLENKAAEIGDAVSPGGSGDPFAGLNEMEAAVFEEVAAMGVPIKAWEDFQVAFQNATPTGHHESLRRLIIPMLKGSDPSYVEDFWTKDGYAGSEESELGKLFRDSLITFNATVEALPVGSDGAPVGLVLDDVPAGINTNGLEFSFESEGVAHSFYGLLDTKTRHVIIYEEVGATVREALEVGSELRIDNRWWLAICTYHRHQVPTREGYYAYDYLLDGDGKPLYPQRDVLLAPNVARSTSGGGTHTGKITAKVMVLNTLYDYDAVPWLGDWYKNVVQEALGDQFEDNFQLHFADNADHYMGPVPKTRQARLIDFTGVQEQHLRDLAAWVEKDVKPPTPVRYQVTDGQVLLPSTACQRRGIQPVVDLTVGGEQRIVVSAGEAVKFSMRAEVPPKVGKIVSVEWDFQGTGDYVGQGFGEASRWVQTEAEFSYDEPGVYFAGVRVASHRDGDSGSEFARPLNLARVRVIVN